MSLVLKHCVYIVYYICVMVKGTDFNFLCKSSILEVRNLISELHFTKVRTLP